MRRIVSRSLAANRGIFFALSLLIFVQPAYSKRVEDDRPPSRHTLDSTRYPIRIHWVDDQPPGRVQRVLELFEKSWRIQIEQWGWMAPLPDNGKGGDNKLDVHLLPLDDGQADTIQDTVFADPFASASCYIQLDQKLPDDGTLESYVHHELNHAIQFALDPYETDAFYEQAATLVERLLLPGSPEATSGNADFQRSPHRALDSKTQEKGDRYEYGSALFLQYITAAYGHNRPDLTYQIWLGSRQPARAKASDPNEPDWVDALPQVLKQYHAPPLEDVLLDFQVWRLTEGLANKIPAPSLVVSNGRPLQFASSPQQAPAPWGVNYFKLDTQGASSLNVQLKDGGQSSWRLWAGATTTSGQWLSSRTTEMGAGEAKLQLPIAGARWVYLTVLNYGSEPKDPDLQQWQGQPYRLTFSWK